MKGRYVLMLLIISTVLLLGAYFIIISKDSSQQFWYYGEIAMFFILGLVVKRLYEGGIGASNSVFYRRAMGASGLRMFFCLIYLLIYVVINELRAMEFFVFFLISYLLFTIFEIYQIVSTLRPEKNSRLENTTS